MRELKIHTDYIELQSALKLLDYTYSGGAAKKFLSDNMVFVNDERELRRGRKMYPGDSLTVNKEVYKVVHENKKIKSY